MSEPSPINPLERIVGPFALLRFSLPSVATMLFMGLYTLVDVIFVSRFASTDAMSAINISTPLINLIVGFATMLATGGNAIVSAKMGQGKERQACADFTLIVLFGAFASLIVAVLGVTFAMPISYGLGATERLVPHCGAYLSVLLAFTPMSMMQVLLQNYVIAAGRPGVGTAMAVLCGLSNIAFDYLFLAVFDMGIKGAAWGTAIGYTIATVIGLVFFASRKTGLRFASPSRKPQIIFKSCTNGASEMVSQAAAAVTTFLFNVVMIRLAGENGVAAITIMIYSQFMISAVFIGFSMGIAPVIAYNYGKGDKARLREVFLSGVGCIWMASLALTVMSFFGAPAITELFVPQGSTVHGMALEGMRLFSLTFLFAGTNIFASALFTALSNGKLSALISFMRTFGFIPLSLLVLQALMGVTGVFLSVPVAEGIAFLLSVCLVWRSESHYGYLKRYRPESKE